VRGWSVSEILGVSRVSLMIDVTTAALMATFQDAMKKTILARNQDKTD
jgi:hypothetical protein